jgi:hypothetical protein
MQWTYKMVLKIIWNYLLKGTWNLELFSPKQVFLLMLVVILVSFLNGFMIGIHYIGGN